MSYFCRFQCVCDQNCHVLFLFSLFLVSNIRLGSTKMHHFSESRNRKGVGCGEGCKTPKYELCKGREEGGGAINREGAFITINKVGTFKVRYVGYFGTPWMTLN